MTLMTHSRRDFLVRSSGVATLGIAELSGMSAFATPRTLASAAGAGAKPIPYGAAVRVDALTSDLS